MANVTASQPMLQNTAAQLKGAFNQLHLQVYLMCLTACKLLAETNTSCLNSLRQIVLSYDMLVNTRSHDCIEIL